MSWMLSSGAALDMDMEREWPGQGGIIPALEMEDGGKEQVHGCGWQRGTVALCGGGATQDPQLVCGLERVNK